jgi:hypothetical protein
MPTNAKSYGILKRIGIKNLGKSRYKGNATMQSMENFIGSTYGTMTSGKTIRESRNIATRNRNKKESLKQFRTQDITTNSGVGTYSSLTNKSRANMRFKRDIFTMRERRQKEQLKEQMKPFYAAPRKPKKDPFAEGLNNQERNFLNQLYGARSLFKRSK